MNSKVGNTQQSTIDDDIAKMMAIYSDADQETLSDELLGVIKLSDVVKILDETSTQGPGTLRDVLRVCSALGKIDASLAWVVGVANSAWSMRGSFHSLDPSSMEQNKILAMVLGRPAVLKQHETTGHYWLTGEWRYASGWPYSSFFFCLAAVEGDGPPNIKVVMVPSEQLEVAASWQATGLRGTQSVTVRAQQIEIPNSHTEDYTRILSGGNRAQASSASTDDKKQASYSGLFTGVLMNCLLGSMLGATEAGLEHVANTADKHPVLGSTYTSMNDSGAIRAEIGRLRSQLDLYKRAAEYNADVIDKVARDASITLTVQERVDNRGRATSIMRGCVNIVQDLLWIYGASGLYKGNLLERIWRDVNVGARHGGFSKLVAEEAVGLAMIGRDPTEVTRMF